MNRKNGLICVLIVTVLSLCVVNVTATSITRPTTVTHNGYATELRSQPQPAISLSFIANGQQISTATVGQKVDIIGYLGVPGNPPTVIGRATVKVYVSKDGTTWGDGVVGQTFAHGNYTGSYHFTWTPNSAGTFYFKTTFDGSSEYMPCQSSIKQITVTSG